jgi:hypothetical protein
MFCVISTFAFALTMRQTQMVLGQVPRLVAPNVVIVSSRLVTSGQPSADALSDLKSLGFEVIYLHHPLSPTRCEMSNLSLPDKGSRLSTS